MPVVSTGISRRRSKTLEEALTSLWNSLESPHSKRAYREDWKRWCDWLKVEGIEAVDARPGDVERYLYYQSQKSRATRQRTLSILRAIYGALTVAEIISFNPAREVKNPKVSTEPRTPWTDEKGLRKLVEEALVGDNFQARRDRMCFLLTGGLGWRRSEIANLRVESFSTDLSQVTGIMKGKKQIIVGVPTWLREEISNWLVQEKIDTGAILRRGQDNEISISGDIVYDAVKRIAKKVGLQKIGPHGIRRTFITLTGKLGRSLKERQLAVGHSQSATTERYDKARLAAENAPGEALADIFRARKK